MRFKREDLLHKLESVTPGIATREAIEQSSCFVFKGGRVITFNDEVACSNECKIGFEGAVAAKPLLELLKKMVEDVVDISVAGGELLVKGKRRRSGITLEAEIMLPVDSIEPPTEWAEIGVDFADAINVVQHCAGKDPNNFHLMCIHMTPKYVEACDNYQVVRYKVDTGVTENCLIKKDSFRHIVGLGMTEVSVGATWVHYRNPVGLMFSVRRESMDFESIDKILKTTGTKTTLPGGISEAVEKAEIFSSENSDNNVVVIELRTGELRIKGQGASGWYEERKEIKWEGDKFSFSIAPKLLVDVAARTNDCYIAPGILKVDGGKFVYVTCLGKVE